MSELYRQYPEYFLDKNMDDYYQHVSAMTSEALNSKAEIAAELAWRDYQIEQLKAQNTRAGDKDE